MKIKKTKYYPINRVLILDNMAFNMAEYHLTDTAINLCEIAKSTAFEGVAFTQK